MVLSVLGPSLIGWGAWVSHNLGRLRHWILGNGNTGLLARVDELESADLSTRLLAAEKKIEELRGRIHAGDGNLSDRMTVTELRSDLMWDEYLERKKT